MKKRACETCPQYETCSVNVCPLEDDPEIKTLNKIRYFESGRRILPSDPERNCRAQRRTREKIAKMFGLTNGGLTKRDIRKDAAKERWERLPDEEKTRRKEILERVRQNWSR